MYPTREVWPDDVFGAQNMDITGQRDIIKKIFLDPVSGMCQSFYVCLYLLSPHLSVYVHLSVFTCVHICMLFYYLIELMSVGIADASVEDGYDEGRCSK